MDRHHPRVVTTRIPGGPARSLPGRRARLLPGIALGLVLAVAGVGCGSDKDASAGERTPSSGTPSPTPDAPPAPISSGLGAPSTASEQRQPVGCRLPDPENGARAEIALVYGKPATQPWPGTQLTLQTRDPNSMEAQVEVQRTAPGCRATSVVVFRGPDAVQTLGLEITASATYPDYDDNEVARIDVVLGAP